MQVYYFLLQNWANLVGLGKVIAGFVSLGKAGFLAGALSVVWWLAVAATFLILEVLILALIGKFGGIKNAFREVARTMMQWAGIIGEVIIDRMLAPLRTLLEVLIAIADVLGLGIPDFVRDFANESIFTFNPGGIAASADRLAFDLLGPTSQESGGSFSEDVSAGIGLTESALGIEGLTDMMKTAFKEAMSEEGVSGAGEKNTDNLAAPYQ